MKYVNAYTYIANLSELLPDIPADSIISRTLYADEGLKVVLFGFAAGQELSEHTASRPAMLLILQGEADLTLGDDSLEARAGAWIHMPPLLRHSIYARTPVVMLLLLTQAAIPENPDDPPV